MKKSNELQEKVILSGLKQGDEKAFSLLFHLYYRDLVLFCGNYINDLPTCEDIIQSIFMKLWKDRYKLSIETSIKSYLLRAVKNSCYDEYRHQNIVRQHESQYQILEDYDTENYILYSDLHTHLMHALDKIPEKYRDVFKLNRFEGVKYKELAELLNVSERTIEVDLSVTPSFLTVYRKLLTFTSLKYGL